MSRTILIVGSGLAGYNFARELRRVDSDSRLVIASRDSADYYSKPMLSNALSGGKDAARLVMKPCVKMRDELAADIRSRSPIKMIDTAARTVAFEDGETLGWDVLVLALGADPIRLDLAGDGADDVFSINDLDDFARFESRLHGVRRVAILGAGLIGCEFANDLLARDIQPTVYDISDRPLGRLLPSEAAQWFRSRLESAGVHFGLSRRASAVHRGTSGYRVEFEDGTSEEADLVLSAVGLRPRTELARAAGLEVARGIVTDRMLATSAPDVYALGDCAEVCGINLPFITPIMHQARALAATLSGTPTPLRYPAMPVTVKTPACPTVVCPPAAADAGSWSLSPTDDGAGLEARCTDEDGTLLGFALLGQAVSRKKALAAEAPAILEA